MEYVGIFLQLAQVGLLCGIFFRLGTHSIRLKVLEHVVFNKKGKGAIHA